MMQRQGGGGRGRQQPDGQRADARKWKQRQRGGRQRGGAQPGPHPAGGQRAFEKAPGQGVDGGHSQNGGDHATTFHQLEYGEGG